MNQNLSAPLLEKILINKFRYDRTIADRLTNQIRSEMGLPDQSQGLTALLNKMAYEKIAQVVSLRLLENNRSIPLISVDDFDEVLEIIAEDKITESFPGERELTINVLKPAINTFIQTVMRITDGSDPYDSYWKVVNATVALAEDEDLPLDQPLDPDMYDEVTRRVYTREQYANQSAVVFELISDPEKLVRMIADPILDSMDLDEMERSIAEEEVKRMVEVQLKPAFEKMLPLMHKIIDAEVNRIYS